MNDAMIFMQSRTGSSMVAAVFRAHGWLTGGDHVKSRNYVTHENPNVRAHLLGRYGPRRTPVTQASPDDDLRRLVRGEFGSQPFVWKGDVFYASVWIATFPDAGRIYVKRDIPAAVRSGLKGRPFPIARDGRWIDYETAASELTKFLEVKYALMDELATVGAPGVIVDASAAMRGDFSTLQAAIEHCGGTWDPDVAAKVVRTR